MAKRKGQKYKPLPSVMRYTGKKQGTKRCSAKNQAKGK